MHMVWVAVIALMVGVGVHAAFDRIAFPPSAYLHLNDNDASGEWEYASLSLNGAWCFSPDGPVRVEVIDYWQPDVS
jgi:hypothetical protein